MSVSIVSCPSCKSLILSDTLQCPSCNHILRPELAEHLHTELPAINRASEDTVPCPDCGEQVRRGLVRCWRCGGFLREEIASTYQKMLEGSQKATLSPSHSQPEGEVPESASHLVEDDDFELAPGLNLMSAEELPHDLFREGQETPPELDTEGDTFRITRSAETTPSADVSHPKPVSSVPRFAHGPVPKSKAESTAESADAGAAEAALDETHAGSAVSAKSTEPEPPPSTGDPLLDIALREEQEAESRRKERAKAKRRGDRVALPGFVFVYCPHGHQIQVEEKYRGMTGRCPKCKSFFHVPVLDWQKAKEAEKKAAEEQVKQSKYKHWMLDSHLHSLDPTKLKLKPGSLEKEFQEIDLGFTDEGLLIVAHGKQGAGLFKGEKNKKRKDELRTEVQDYLRLDKVLLDLPAAGYRFYEKDMMPRVQVVQPAAYAHESMFAGVPVFGEGRIAVRLPLTDQDKDVKDILFVSFYISEFREFAARLAELFGVKDLGNQEGVPLLDNVKEYKCHYTDRVVKSLEVTPFHKADSKLQLEVTGRRCQACGLVVSEEARKKEKLGGPAGKSIAKAPCPKCKQKFGDNTLYGLKQAADTSGEDATLGETGGLKTAAMT